MKLLKSSIIFNVIILLCCLILILEFSARYFLGLGDPPLTIAHPKIEYLFKTNQDIVRFGNRVSINSFSMRSKAFPLHKEVADSTRVMMFGDSVLNGGNLTDQSDLATAILDDKWSEKYSKRVITGNISAGSWGPGNWLAYAQEYGFFDADIIILLISSHDWADNPTFKPLNPNTHPQETPFSALVEGVTRYLPRYLPFKKEIKVRGKIDISNNAKNGMSDLKSFLNLALIATKNVYVFHYPEKNEITSNEMKRGYASIMSLCDKMSIVFVPLQPRFSQYYKLNKDLYRENDNIHPNVFGQKIIADEIYKSIPDAVFLTNH